MGNLKFNNVYLKDRFTLVGPKQDKSKISNYDLKFNDYYFDMPTFEQAEIKMQRVVIENLLKRNHLAETHINYVIGGDLLNQIAISSYAMMEYKIPFVGVYAACSTFPLSLILGSNLIESKNAKNIICLTSSHNLTAERQYRYPIEYGSVRPSTATSTITASVGAILSNEHSNIKITNALIGKVVNLGINDVNHMGAIMAPACADSIYTFLKNSKENVKDYDLILTGDLGCIGLEILKEYYETVYKEKLTKIMDAGCEIFLESEMYSGASGPCCLPLILFTKILKNKKYKKILLVGSGALHAPVLVNQHQTVPAISHIVRIEVVS